MKEAVEEAGREDDRGDTLWHDNGMHASSHAAYYGIIYAIWHRGLPSWQYVTRIPRT